MDNLARLRRKMEQMGGEPLSDEYLLDALESAKYAILARRYPSQEYPINAQGEDVLPRRYLDLQYRLAVEILARDGAEGQVHHTENQVNRQYQDPYVSKQLLLEVVPLVKVMKY